jgi:hypothetical protein
MKAKNHQMVNIVALVQKYMCRTILSSIEGHGVYYFEVAALTLDTDDIVFAVVTYLFINCC